MAVSESDSSDHHEILLYSAVVCGKSFGKRGDGGPHSDGESFLQRREYDALFELQSGCLPRSVEGVYKFELEAEN